VVVVCRDVGHGKIVMQVKATRNGRTIYAGESWHPIGGDPGELKASIKERLDAQLLSIDHHGNIRHFLDENKPTRLQQILRPPGARLDSVASFVFTRHIYQTVLRPCLAETQEEYFEALSQGHLRKAQWVRFRGVINFWSHVVLQMPVSFTRTVRRLWTVAGS
jgi:hypothetical protein